VELGFRRGGAAATAGHPPSKPRRELGSAVVDDEHRRKLHRVLKEPRRERGELLDRGRVKREKGK